MRIHMTTAWATGGTGTGIGRASGLALALAGSLALAACGSSDDDAATPEHEGPSRVDIAPSDDPDGPGGGDETGSESSSGAAGGDESSSDAGSGDAPSDGSSSGIPLPDPNDVDLATTTFDVTWQDAVATALERFDGDVTSVELDWKRSAGDYAYSIELQSDAAGEYEVDVHASTGEVVAESADPDSDADADDVLDLDAVTVDVADAMQTALDERPGAVVEWTLDTDDGAQVFTFDVVTADGGDDLDITVDAATGESVEIDD
jgi:uncharacterized membrane protein YkoI